MIELFLKFRNSWYWYLFIIISITIITYCLKLTAEKSKAVNKRLLTIIMTPLLLAIFFCLVIMVFVVGLPADYNSITITIFSIFILVAGIYVIKKEKK